MEKVITLQLSIAKDLLEGLNTNLHLPMRLWPARNKLKILVHDAEQS